MRFIPARAGNTPATTSDLSALSVHPRPRGEHLKSDTRHIAHRGSSPPARGTPGVCRVDRVLLRFIPARAGNTVGWRISATSASVHPRPRGEHDGTGPVPYAWIGSSPPARGTQRSDRARRPRSRFIPARAGNTRRRAKSFAIGSVHPRPRGEHVWPRSVTWVVAGSSPPARGTLLHPGRWRPQRRFIPARAGNTPSPRLQRRRCTVHPRPRGEHRLRQSVEQ